MGWEDRQYNRAGGSSLGMSLWNLLNSSMPIGRWFGIRVLVHASFIIFAAWTLIDKATTSLADLQMAAAGMAILFFIILLHEFGHCFAAWMVGGESHEIVMWLLGGLAYSDVPHRPWPRFVNVAGGPLINVLICVVAAGAMMLLGRSWHAVPWNPYGDLFADPWTAQFFLLWIYGTSLALLLFNLLPIFPMDGGQLLQTILWATLGYFRSMNISCIVGMIGSAGIGVYGITQGSLLFALVGASFFWYCLNQRRALWAMGVEETAEPYDLGGSLATAERPRRKRLTRRAIRRARRLAQEEEAEQVRIDAILAKVSAHGMHSLTWWEKRTLRKATERQRERQWR